MIGLRESLFSSVNDFFSLFFLFFFSSSHNSLVIKKQLMFLYKQYDIMLIAAFTHGLKKKFNTLFLEEYIFACETFESHQIQLS